MALSVVKNANLALTLLLELGVLLQIVFFGSAALALYVAVSPGLGVAWAIVCLINAALNHAWKQ